MSLAITGYLKQPHQLVKCQHWTMLIGFLCIHFAWCAISSQGTLFLVGNVHCVNLISSAGGPTVSGWIYDFVHVNACSTFI